MSSPKKIEANRRNSQKSTGPKTDRGKLASSQNAVRLGVYATARLLPGERKAAYQKIARDLTCECQPTGPLQKILIDQIIGAYWRVQRIERAERLFFIEIRSAQISRYLQSLNNEELGGGRSNTGGERAVHTIDGAENFRHTTDTEQFHNRWRKIEHRRRLRDWDSTMLEGLVPSAEARPKICLDQQRRAAMRELIHMLVRLREIQNPGSRRNY